MSKIMKRAAHQVGTLADKAYETFVRHNRKDVDENSRRYVHRSTGLLTAMCQEGTTKSRFRAQARRLDPFVLLTALRSSQTANYYEEQVHLGTPFVTLLMGPYGAGKTEFVLRICQFLRQFPPGLNSRPVPLPIELALCRPAAKKFSTTKPSAATFAQLIFGPLFQDKAAIHIAARAVRNGEAFLILDALDELIDSPEGHANFFAGLRAFLTDEGRPGPCRVLVTMREEYFHAVEHHTRAADNQADNHDYIVLNRLNPDGRNQLTLGLIELDYFTDDEIWDYLRRSLDRHDDKLLREKYKELASQFVLFSSLHRPLLLRVFVDLIKSNPAALDKLRSASGHPADLIAEYIHSVDQDAHQRQARLNETADADGPGWNFDQLARECMALYSKGESALDLEAIARVVGTSEPADAQLLVHKCSFLIHDLGTVRFSHRVFFEYFTAKGVVLDMELHAKDCHDPFGADKSKAFNDYVLNSDMRKFLRRMIETNAILKGARFHDLTKRSCGFKDEDGWPMGRAKFERLKDALGKCQECLVDGMTAPDPSDEREGRDRNLAKPDKIATQIRWFLDEQHEGFHPLYLVYCYHAVATYLKPRWLAEGWKDCRWKLYSQLKGSLDRAIDHVTDPKRKASWQHLVERILFVAAWLRLDWVPTWLRDRKPASWLREGEWEAKSYDRLKHILGDIRAIYCLPEND